MEANMSDTLDNQLKRLSTLLESADNALIKVTEELAQLEAENESGKSMSIGVSMISAERKRQIESEGWAPEHDDKHIYGELATAGASYAMLAGRQECFRVYCIPHGVESTWPFDQSWWKPSADPIRNLVKAGAMIAAEIDRLKRQQE
jgi:hypothetical protein